MLLAFACLFTLLVDAFLLLAQTFLFFLELLLLAFQLFLLFLFSLTALLLLVAPQLRLALLALFLQPRLLGFAGFLGFARLLFFRLSAFFRFGSRPFRRSPLLRLYESVELLVELVELALLFLQNLHQVAFLLSKLLHDAVLLRAFSLERKFGRVYRVDGFASFILQSHKLVFLLFQFTPCRFDLSGLRLSPS